MSKLAELLPEGATFLHLQPGDSLVIGNVGQIPMEQFTEVVDRLREWTGIAQVVVFDGDIDLAILREGGLISPEAL